MAEDVSPSASRLRARWLIVVLIQLICMSVVPGFCQEKEPRIALVIGNSSYSALGKLANPGNDAADMAKALQGLGFSVTLLTDADQRSMEQGVVRFGNALSTSPLAIGFFFYAGHGVQSNGINYLIPANTEIPSESFLNTKAVALQALLDTLQQAENKLNVVVLDACRNNPFSWSRSGTRGLSVVSAQPPGSIIAYATSAGSVAADGKGRNGIYTGELLKNLNKSDMSIFDLFLQTGAQVKAVTNGAQVPAIYNQFFDKFYLSQVLVEVPSPDQSSEVTDRVIYNAGWYLNGSMQIPCYWAGTRRFDLAGDGVHDARSRACAVSKGTVYNAGWWNDGKKDNACYWAGTRRTDLAADGVGGAQATSIVVSHDTVYIGGQCNDGHRVRPCYWQGTRRVDLDSSGSPNSGVWSIAVSGGVVYTAGWWNDGTRDIACFWTGTRRTDLDSGTKGSYANVIAVSNGMVYTAGAWDWDGKVSRACYWVGTSRTDIGAKGSAWAINVSKGVVSAAGYMNEQERWIPWLWAKGARTDLADGGHPGFVCSSSFTAGIFCPSGFCWDGTKNVACYWMETYRVDLDGGDGGSMAGAPAFFTGK